MTLIAEAGFERDVADGSGLVAQRDRGKLEAATARELADGHTFVAVELARDVAGMAPGFIT